MGLLPAVGQLSWLRSFADAAAAGRSRAPSTASAAMKNLGTSLPPGGMKGWLCDWDTGDVPCVTVSPRTSLSSDPPPPDPEPSEDGPELEEPEPLRSSDVTVGTGVVVGVSSPLPGPLWSSVSPLPLVPSSPPPEVPEPDVPEPDVPERSSIPPPPGRCRVVAAAAAVVARARAGARGARSGLGGRRCGRPRRRPNRRYGAGRSGPRRWSPCRRGAARRRRHHRSRRAGRRAWWPARRARRTRPGCACAPRKTHAPARRTPRALLGARRLPSGPGCSRRRARRSRRRPAPRPRPPWRASRSRRRPSRARPCGTPGPRVLPMPPGRSRAGAA